MVRWPFDVASLSVAAIVCPRQGFAWNDDGGGGDGGDGGVGGMFQQVRRVMRAG
jgi:hypothetical protein